MTAVPLSRLVMSNFLLNSDSLYIDSMMSFAMCVCADFCIDGTQVTGVSLLGAARIKPRTPNPTTFLRLLLRHGPSGKTDGSFTEECSWQATPVIDVIRPQPGSLFRISVKNQEVPTVLLSAKEARRLLIGEALVLFCLARWTRCISPTFLERTDKQRLLRLEYFANTF